MGLGAKGLSDCVEGIWRENIQDWLELDEGNPLDFSSLSFYTF
jgi:hypothetical protein